MKSFKSGVLRLLLGCGLLVPLAGCGDGMARVSGEVLLDGEAVTKTDKVRCQVTLKPASGGPAATGSVDEYGAFRLSVGSSESVPPGEYAASVRVREVTPAANRGGYPSSRNLSPERFASTSTSGLTYTLEPGSNEITIEIESE